MIRARALVWTSAMALPPVSAAATTLLTCVSETVGRGGSPTPAFSACVLVAGENQTAQVCCCCCCCCSCLFLFVVIKLHEGLE